MANLMDIYRQERERMERELVLISDLSAATDCLCAGLERIRLEYLRDAQDRRRWNEISRMFDVARQAVRCMLAVSGAEVSVVSEKSVARTPQEALAIAMPIVSIVVGAALTVWLILEDMNVPAALSAVLTAIAWLEAQTTLRRQVALKVRMRIDRSGLIRQMDRLMEAVGAYIENAEERHLPDVPAGDQPTLTGDLLEPVQMLMEAVNTQDGDYALKAVPRLTAALLGQGIEAVDYAPETREYFDMFPGTEPDLTIRPALLKDGRVLVRGQATERL